MFNRQFSYIDRYADTDAVTVSRWVNEVTYVNDKGMVVMYLNRNVISMISRLEANFTQYLLEQVSEFKSKYSIRLYELLIKYRDIGTSKKFEIAELRSKLGLEDNEYKLNAVFKRDVLDKAVKEINDKTDITIKYEQFKDGRIITHIMFKMKKKPIKKNDRADQNTVDMFADMTAKQINMFGDKLSRDKDFQRYYLAKAGDSTEQYAQDIKFKLLDPFYVESWMPYLEKLGFVPSNKKGA